MAEAREPREGGSGAPRNSSRPQFRDSSSAARSGRSGDSGGYQRREGGARAGGFNRDGDRRDGDQRRDGGYQRRDGEQRREGGRPEGGYQRRDGEQRRDGGFQRRDGGFQRRDGEQRRDGGFQRRDGGRPEGGRPEGGYQRRDGEQRRDGGYQRREGGRPEGGYQRRDNDQRRDGGYQRREGGRPEGAFQRRDGEQRRDGGYQRRDGGYQRREGGRPEGGFQRRDGEQRRDGGFQRGEGGRPEGGYQRRDGDQRRDGGFQRRDGDRRDGGFRSEERRSSRPPQDVRADRPRDPELPDEITSRSLHGSARNELKTLSVENADTVARHLAAVSTYIDEDPALAHEHALAASRRAGRLAIVHETLGITAYATGDFALALRELRTNRRISGSEDLIALIVDAERGNGRPEKALEEGRSVNRSNLDVETRVQLAIAMSGARLDLGQGDSALAELDIPELNPNVAYSWSADLFAARGAVLEELGREDEAQEWFRRAEVALAAVTPDDSDEMVVVEETLDEDLAAEIEAAEWEAEVAEAEAFKAAAAAARAAEQPAAEEASEAAAEPQAAAEPERSLSEAELIEAELIEAEVEELLADDEAPAASEAASAKDASDNA